MKKGILVAAALSLVSSTAFAQPAAPVAPASKLSVSSAVRASTPAKRSSKIGPSFGVILGVLGIVAGGVIVAASGDDNPDSP